MWGGEEGRFRFGDDLGRLRRRGISSCNRYKISKAYKALAIMERERNGKGDMVISGPLSKMTSGMVSHHLLSHIGYAMHELRSIDTWHQLSEGTTSSKPHFTRKPGQWVVGNPFV